MKEREGESAQCGTSKLAQMQRAPTTTTNGAGNGRGHTDQWMEMYKTLDSHAKVMSRRLGGDEAEALLRPPNSLGRLYAAPLPAGAREARIPLGGEARQRAARAALERVKAVRRGGKRATALAEFHRYLGEQSGEHIQKVLLDAFTMTQADFPHLSIAPVSDYADATGEGDEDERRAAGYARPWVWPKVSYAAEAFTQISEARAPPGAPAPEGGERAKDAGEDRRELYRKIVSTAWFRKAVWGRWLKGVGAGPGSGRCSRNTAVYEVNRVIERYHVDERARTVDPRWYSVGYLSSVLLHTVLKNSADNAIAARDIIIRLTELIELHDLIGQDAKMNPYDPATPRLRAERDRLIGAGVLPMTEAVAVATKPPEWMDGWLRGEQPHPPAWHAVDVKLRAKGEPSLFSKMASRRHMQHSAWFAAELSHGALYLDFVAPGAHRMRYNAVAPERSSYSRVASTFLTMVREAASGDAPLPFVVRLPAVLLGRCLGAGRQMVWGYTGEAHSKTWIRAPELQHASYKPYSAQPVSGVGAIVISGVTAPAPDVPPPIGLALPDEPTTLLRTPEEHAEGGPALDEVDDPYDKGEIRETRETVQNWYRTIMDLWVADLRVDTPEALLALAERVGARYPRAIAASSFWTLRGFERRLGDELVPDAMSRPRTTRNVLWGAELVKASRPRDTMYQDGKNLILSRLWMSPPPRAWLDDGTLGAHTYDVGRRVWVLDVGPGTIQTRALLLKRCHGGPALPRIVPMLTMEHLVYTVPVYRIPGSSSNQEDLPRIMSHGLIDHIVATPRTTFVLDRVAFSPRFLENSYYWMPSHTIPYGDLRAEVIREQQRRLERGEGAGGGAAASGPLGGLLIPKPPQYNWDHLADDDLLARTTRQVFSVPDVPTSRVDIDTAKYVVKRISDTARKAANASRHLLSPYVVFDTLQWTNILFQSGVNLGSFLAGLDGVNTFYAKRVILSLHPALLTGSPGSRVPWPEVRIKPFLSLAMRQLSLRLDMTEPPGKLLRLLGKPRFLEGIQAFPTENDRLYLDFEGNRIQSIPVGFLEFANENRYLKRRLRMLLAGNEIPPEHPAVPGVMLLRSPAGAIKRDREGTVDRELRDAAARGEDPSAVLRREDNHIRASLASVLQGYFAGYDADDTVGWNVSSVYDRPGPDLNPYGADWAPMANARRGASTPYVAPAATRFRRPEAGF